MCPLRIILIFLSATLAGFFVLRNLKTQPNFHDADADANANADADDSTAMNPLPESSPSSTSVDRSSKVSAAIGTGFWTFVDMASGRYLWRNLVSSPKRVY